MKKSFKEARTPKNKKMTPIQEHMAKIRGMRGKGKKKGKRYGKAQLRKEIRGLTKMVASQGKMIAKLAGIKRKKGVKKVAKRVSRRKRK